MKPKTTTEVVTKALARSGPEITPEQIRLSDDAQPDKNKVYTQRDYNESVNAGGGGGGGGGGIAPDLKDYAKTEYVDAGDAALDGKIAQVAKDLDVVENDYTTTAEFNVVSKKASDNKKEIAALQEAFDTAVAAAQDGAENLEIELQSYAKKEDIPSGGSVRYPIKEVLAEGNVAEAGQTLHFRVTEGDIPPFKRDNINIQGGSGFRLGGLVSTYSLNEPFSIDTEHGVTMPFDSSVNRISGADIYIYGNHPKLDASVVEASIGLNGITYSAEDTSLDIEPNYVRFAVGEYLNENFKIVANSDSSSVRATEVEATTVTATEFIGDGSKLTNLPTSGGASGGINEVLAEGDTADAGQNLHFKLKEGDIPDIPYTKDIIEIDGGSGFRLGGLVSYMTMNEPFSVDTAPSPFGLGIDIEVTEFQKATRRMSAADDYYYSSNERGDWWCGVGLTGINFRDGGVYTRFSSSEIRLRFEDPNDSDAVFLDLDASTYNNEATLFCQTITANEFIGDGSKLTNLPTSGAAAPALPGHKWKLIPYSAAEKPGPGEMMHDDASQTYLLNVVDADGIVLGNPAGVFDAYSVNGTMCVSLFKQGTGLEGLFKAAAVALKTDLGKTFFQIVEANHARLNLEEGQTYSVTASGLF